MLTVHHLGWSQSERIVWLCEELGIDYTLVHHKRDPVTRLSPPELKALHPLGAAPVITDGDLLLAESGAIVDYLIQTRGGGTLTVQKDAAGFADYLYWFHFANGNLQPVIGRMMVLRRLNPPADHPVLQAMTGRMKLVLELIEARLGSVPHLAGEAFTAADIMSVFTLTTMRLFSPYDLSPYPNILAYLQRIGARPAYQRAMKKGDPDLTPLLTAENPPFPDKK